MKRYVVIEIDEDWGDNTVLDEVQALPCITRFYGPMSAQEARAALEEERRAVIDVDAP